MDAAKKSEFPCAHRAVSFPVHVWGCDVEGERNLLCEHSGTGIREGEGKAGTLSLTPQNLCKVYADCSPDISWCMLHAGLLLGGIYITDPGSFEAIM